MNLRNWSKQHTWGLLLGVITTLISIPIVLFIYSKIYNDESIWFRFSINKVVQSKMFSLASITNLIWFHLSMRWEKYPLGMGVILATFINLLIILYLKFF